MDNYEIIWSPIASFTYIDILEYLQENWPEKVLVDFIHRTEEVLKFISLNPKLYTYSNELDAYKSVIVKQVSLFYRIRANQAELLMFWDNRQDLAKLLLI